MDGLIEVPAACVEAGCRWEFTAADGGGLWVQHGSLSQQVADATAATAWLASFHAPPEPVPPPSLPPADDDVEGMAF